MKNIFLIMMSVLLMSTANAANIKPILEKDSIQIKAFITNLDRLGDSISNITIQNTSGTTFTITGIFIRQLFQAGCSTSYFNQPNNLYGAIWSNDITLDTYETTPLGAGYLYSMMMNYLYEASTTSGPTATTPGNDPGPGTGTRTWCIQLGVLQGGPAQSPTSSVTTTTSPSSTLSNVVNNPLSIEITCTDSTQQCTANSGVTQVFP